MRMNRSEPWNLGAHIFQTTQQGPSSRAQGATNIATDLLLRHWHQGVVMFSSERLQGVDPVHGGCSALRSATIQEHEEQKHQKIS